MPSALIDILKSKINVLSEHNNFIIFYDVFTCRKREINFFQ